MKARPSPAATSARVSTLVLRRRGLEVVVDVRGVPSAPTKGIGSSAGEAARAAASAAATTAATSDTSARSAATVATAVPPSTSAVAVTARLRACISPLVVSALAAQRRLTS